MAALKETFVFPSHVAASMDLQPDSGYGTSPLS
jgi:hypothetical protein